MYVKYYGTCTILFFVCRKCCTTSFVNKIAHNLYNARHYKTSHSAPPRNVTSIRLLLSQRFHTGNRTSTISPGIISFYLVVATVPVPLDKLKMKLSKAFSRLAFAARADNLMRCNVKTCWTHIDNTFQLMYITVSSSYVHFKAQQQPH